MKVVNFGLMKFALGEYSCEGKMNLSITQNVREKRKMNEVPQ